MRFSRFFPVAFAAVAVLPAVSSAQISIQNIGPKFTSGNTVTIGNPSVTGTAAVGPYQSIIAGQPNSPFDVYCIDWDNQFGTASPYNVRVLTFAEAVSTTLSFNGIDNFTALKRVLGTEAFNAPGGIIPNNSTEYFNRLVLESGLASQFGPLPTTDWDEIHHAMWSLFNTADIYLPDGDIAGSDAQLLNGALFVSTPGYDFSNWRILVDQAAWNTVDQGDYHQALISQSVVPEPGTYLLVGVGLLGMFGMNRRRSRSTAN